MESKERICKCGNVISPNSKSKRCEACNNRKVSIGKKVAAGVVVLGSTLVAGGSFLLHRLKK